MQHANPANMQDQYRTQYCVHVEFTLPVPGSAQNSVYTEYHYVVQGINSHIIVFELIRVFNAELRDCNPEFKLHQGLQRDPCNLAATA